MDCYGLQLGLWSINRGQQATKRVSTATEALDYAKIPSYSRLFRVAFPMASQSPVVFRRPAKGPCIFCLRENVPFEGEEHLPPESIVDRRCYVLIDWVCSPCNEKFSVEDKYFGTHYHGAAARALYSIVGKRGKGAEVALKELWAKFQPKLNTVQLRLRTSKTKDQLLSELSNLDNRQPTTIELNNRITSTRRLGRCLAKMALETVVCTKPEIIFTPELEAVRAYAHGRGKLKYLPFTVGVSQGRYGAALFAPDSIGRSAPVALIWIPASVYAIQVSDFDDLRPLRTVAETMGLVLDDTGNRTTNWRLNLKLDFPSYPKTGS
jgi:hypothetical protein